MTTSIDYTSALRILDVAVNRAAEGLRVIEDLARLHLNDRWLSQQLKETRHSLIRAAEVSHSGSLWIARDILNDVGTEIEATDEYLRQDIRQIVLSNFARVKQSIRSLEEYSKLIDPSVSRNFEQLRYSTYSLEKALMNTLDSCPRLHDCSICVLLDGRQTAADFEHLTGTILDSGVQLIQLRDDRLDDRQLMSRGELLSRMTASGPARWIMNNRADVAVLCGADGVHVGQSDLDVASVRKLVGLEMLIGVSTHDLGQARQAVLEGANYIGMGPVFPSSTKTFETFASPDFIQAVVREISLPAFAIGGIDQNNLSQLLEWGVRRVAVSHAVIQADSPSTAVRQLMGTVQQYVTPLPSPGVE